MRKTTTTTREINHLLYEMVKTPAHKVNFLQAEIRLLVEKEKKVNGKKSA